MIRPEIQEKISVGLLLFDQEKILFSYSRNKIHVFKELMSPNSSRLLKDLMRNIEIKINKETLHESFNIAVGNSTTEKSFSKEYFEYLSRYSNNTIGFSAPKEIKLPVSEETFKMLYVKFIDFIPGEKQNQTKIKTLDYLKDKYKDRLTKHYNIGREITPDDIENLVAPVKIDFIGRNSLDVYVQTLDMEQQSNHISNNIGSLLQVKKAYEISKNPIKDFIVAKEPSKDLKKQHDIWTQLRATGIFDYVDISESEKIVEYAEQHGVLPLFDENNS
ncbi:MAG: hypothetical protein WDO19_17020 [Bacteroidota bacterium]